MSAGGTLHACRLYGIVDLGYVNAADAAGVTRAMIDGGVDIIQLRGKQQALRELMSLAARLRDATGEADIPLVVNDHPEIAREVGAAGVHVGQDDLSVAEAREVAGGNCFVGKSTHGFDQATQAAAEGADYIGFGPLFATPTKPDYGAIGLANVERVHAAVALPVFCIGGIKLENLRDVIAAGARRVVLVSGLLQARDVAEYARSAKALLNRNSKI
ncbi:MAG TPA: thiamine phosphate synthase [Chthoniobacterales bacterium]|nr:thiamine phosphate synthase [Chthoniobacterales bacterium]